MFTSKAWRSFQQKRTREPDRTDASRLGCCKPSCSPSTSPRRIDWVGGEHMHVHLCVDVCIHVHLHKYAYACHLKGLWVWSACVCKLGGLYMCTCVSMCAYRHVSVGGCVFLLGDFAHPVLFVDTFLLSTLLPQPQPSSRSFSQLGVRL